LYYEKALHCDIENPTALRGLWKYYRIKGMDEQADELESRLPPLVENYLYYLNKFGEGSISFPSEKLINYYKYLEHLPEGVPTPWWIPHHVYYIYMRLGFPELAKKYANEEWLIRFSIPLDKYSFDNSWIEEMNGNYDSALVFLQKSDQNYPGNRAGFLMLAARNSMRNRDYETACVYLDSMELVHPEWLEMLSNGDARLIYPFGYSYIKTGQKEKGEHHLRGLIQKYEQEIEQNWVFAQDQFTWFEIALAWSALGNKENSFRYLNRLVELHGCQLWFILELEINPMFDTIRGLVEYEIVLKEFKHNYNQEHQRIKKLVEKMGLEAA
jgi:tetratricopeptide (TPR) repeat protein